jgi:hypothetical protein
VAVPGEVLPMELVEERVHHRYKLLKVQQRKGFHSLMNVKPKKEIDLFLC